MSAGTQCTATTTRGTPCNAYAVTGSQYCFYHAPERATQRAQARRRGGKSRHGRKIGTTGDAGQLVTFGSVADVLSYLESVATDLAALERSVARSRAQVSLAGSVLECLKIGELEQRLERLEQLAGG